MESLILQMPIEHFLYVWGWDGHQMLRPNSGPGRERGGVLTWAREWEGGLSHIRTEGQGQEDLSWSWVLRKHGEVRSPSCLHVWGPMGRW